jgi:sterol desaturase/sphingolipid hydroxylase (fatty acid hydroxylase superfamily)
MPLADRFWLAARAAPAISLTDAFSYSLAAGLAWLTFYVLLKRTLAHRKIMPKFPTRRQLGRELLYSLRSLLVFGLSGAFVVFAGYSGWTKFYLRIDQRGYVWFFVSIALTIVLHDAYFYWTHRLMHHPRLFRRLHRVHHLSTSPSPWAAYSFSTLEAAVQAGIAPLAVMLIPLHPTAFALFMVWQISFNVLGHCGYEIFPQWFLDTWPGKFLNTPTHHAMHHECFRTNFGLYFNVWDRLLGTNHPRYAERFAAVSAPRAVNSAAQ